jgi:uncharacterized protein YjiS (DUF1127 family)
MLNSSGPGSRAARRYVVQDRELHFGLRGDNRAAQQNPAEPERADLADVGSPPGAASRADRVLKDVIPAFIVSSSADAEAKQPKREDRADGTGPKPEAPLSEHASLAESHRSRSFDAGRSGRRHWLTRCWNDMVGRWRRWRHEREIAALVADLAELDDRTLQDMGIPHRSQIERAVRYGRAADAIDVWNCGPGP